MKLIYNNTKISVTTTNNNMIMRYKYQKLYYAIIINNCNRYSSIGSKQRIDIAMTDDKFNILSFKKEMHENTVYENKEATKVILLPLDIFSNIKINTCFKLEE